MKTFMWGCAHLERKSLDIYGSEKCLEKSWRENVMQIVCVQYIFSQVLQFSRQLTKMDFYAVSSHSLRTAGLILIKFYIRDRCTPACFTLFIRQRQEYRRNKMATLHNCSAMSKFPDVLIIYYQQYLHGDRQPLWGGRNVIVICTKIVKLCIVIT